MALLETLVDNFNDGTVGPEWGNAYGGVTEPGGRARIPCAATVYAGYQTARAWTLAGSSVYLQLPVAPAASTGADVSVSFLVTSATAGTSVGFKINSVTGMLRMQANVSYYDAGAVEIAHNPTTHLWLRLREDGTNLHWDTSPDGATWTNRRTRTTPTWIPGATDTCALDIYCYRDAGTTDYAEIDNVNTLSDGAVHTGSATLATTGTLTAAGIHTAIGNTALTATSSLTAHGNLTAIGNTALTATSSLHAVGSGEDDSDPTARLAGPRIRWQVTGPWI